MKPRRRLDPVLRKEEIIAAALAEAAKHGYLNVTREQIAKRAGCTPTLLTHYWGTMIKMRRAIMSAAVAREELPIIAQGLANRDSKARRAPLSVQQAALSTLMG